MPWTTLGNEAPRWALAVAILFERPVILRRHQVRIIWAPTAPRRTVATGCQAAQVHRLTIHGRDYGCGEQWQQVNLPRFWSVSLRGRTAALRQLILQTLVPVTATMLGYHPDHTARLVPKSAALRALPF